MHRTLKPRATSDTQADRQSTKTTNKAAITADTAPLERGACARTDLAGKPVIRCLAAAAARHQVGQVQEAGGVPASPAAQAAAAGARGPH